MYDTKLRSSFGHSTLVPSFGRDLAYAPFSADLLVVGSAPEVYKWVTTLHLSTQKKVTYKMKLSTSVGQHVFHLDAWLWHQYGKCSLLCRPAGCRICSRSVLVGLRSTHTCMTGQILHTYKCLKSLAYLLFPADLLNCRQCL